MQHFKLPLLKAADSVEHACKAMIDGNVSGVVVRNLLGYHLVHFTQIEAAVEQGRKTSDSFCFPRPPTANGYAHVKDHQDLLAP